MIDFTEDTVPTPALPEKPTNKAKSSQTKKGPSESREETPNDKTTSLSFDQVNDNAEELVELRGEGRYFGVDSSGETINAQQALGPLCANCHKRGHIRAKCKTVVCHKCGVVGDHYETQCPTTMVCAKCGEKGHIAANCTNKQKKRQYCKRCDTFSHSDYQCPSIWRLYLTNSKDVLVLLPATYCYNCGSPNHYGDECTEIRLLRVPNPSGSAFLGLNLPKSLRQKYYDRVRQKAIPRRNHFEGSLRYSDSRDYNSGRDYNSSGQSSFRNKNNNRFNGGHNNVSSNYIGSNKIAKKSHNNNGKKASHVIPIAKKPKGKKLPKATRSGVIKRK